MKNSNFINGWNLRSVPVRFIRPVLLSIMLLTSYIAKADSKEMPSMEFLEFLGEGIEVEGEYLDAVNYEDIGSDNETAKQQGNRQYQVKQKENDDE